MLYHFCQQSCQMKDDEIAPFYQVTLPTGQHVWRLGKAVVCQKTEPPGGMHNNFYIHQNPSRESKEINFLFISVKIRNAILTPSFNKQGFIFNGKGSFFYIFAEGIDQMVNTLYTYYPDHCFESSGNPNSYKKQILKLDSPDFNKAVSQVKSQDP